MGPAPLPETGFLDDWAARLRQAADRPVVGIMLRGSHARRAATEHSDVDVDVLVAAGDERPPSAPTRPAVPQPGPAGRPAPDTTYAARHAYLAEFDGRLVHVSVAARDVRSWVDRLGRPADWAFGLPVSAPARLIWAAPEWRRRIDLPVLCQPADEPRLEDLVATLGKVAGACWADDPVGVRLAAADLARLCPSVLRLANPSVRVASRRAALAAVLDLPVAPPGYPEDMRLCLGLRPGAAAAVGAAAGRLVTGIVPLIRPYAGEIAAVAGTDLAQALVDGRLDRYLAQLTRTLEPAAVAVRDTAAVPAPRAGEWSTVPASDAPVTGAPTSPGAAAAPGPARPSRLDPEIAARLRRSADGLVAAVVRQHDSGEVLMVAWMDDEALHRTLTTGRATYWSRSRQEYWVKGATSGHHQHVRSVALDCDGDALLVSVDQVGAACHTGHRTCFFTELPVSAPEAGA